MISLIKVCQKEAYWERPDKELSRMPLSKSEFPHCAAWFRCRSTAYAGGATRCVAYVC